MGEGALRRHTRTQSGLSVHAAERPPIGFILEGAGEYATYPSLATRSLGAAGLHIPRINARGFGGILTGLEEHLDDLVRSYHPLSIIVAMDLRDVVECGLYVDCASLRAELLRRAQSWAASRTGAVPFEPMPQPIGVVIQVQLFETWWLADPDGLRRTGLFQIDPADCRWGNVDQDVSNPLAWLEKRLVRPTNLKSTAVASTVVRARIALGRRP